MQSPKVFEEQQGHCGQSRGARGRVVRDEIRELADGYIKEGLEDHWKNLGFALSQLKRC